MAPLVLWQHNKEEAEEIEEEKKEKKKSIRDISAFHRTGTGDSDVVMLSLSSEAIGHTVGIIGTRGQGNSYQTPSPPFD